VTGPEGTGRARQPLSGGTVAAVAVLILVPFVALLWVSSYAKATPKLWGFPFFYWYQFLWVFLAAGCTFLAYAVLRRARPARPRPAVDRDTDWSGGRHARDREVPLR
jgi:membrane protein implicated in regulation of membrane protease activity